MTVRYKHSIVVLPDGKELRIWRLPKNRGRSMPIETKLELLHYRQLSEVDERKRSSKPPSHHFLEKALDRSKTEAKKALKAAKFKQLVKASPRTIGSGIRDSSGIVPTKALTSVDGTGRTAPHFKVTRDDEW